MTDIRTTGPLTNHDPHETGGAALLLGFLLVLLALYRDPAAGLDAATATAGSVVYFALLPAAGLVAGGYAALGGPYSGVPLFLLGSYLGVFGLGLTFGNLLTGRPDAVLLGGGLVLLVLAVVALVASARRLAGVLHLGSLGTPPE